MHIPEMSQKLYYSKQGNSLDGLPVFSVAWLGNTVPQQGSVSHEIINRLWYFSNTNSQTKVFGTEWRSCGPHTCEICNAYTDIGEIVVSTSKAHTLRIEKEGYETAFLWFDYKMPTVKIILKKEDTQPTSAGDVLEAAPEK